MRTRQRTLRIFELEANLAPEEYISFLQKHLPLLKQHTIAFPSPIDSSVRAFLGANGLNFSHIQNGETHIECAPDSKKLKLPNVPSKANVPSSEQASPKGLESIDSKVQDLPARNLRVIDRRVRSGEEIHHSGDLIVCAQIHNGAHIITEGNLYLLDECSGSIEVRGEILLCTKILAPAILFQGRLLDEDFLRELNQHTFTLMFKKGDIIQTMPLTKDKK